ncbi:hypothetical protein PT974_02234 [Cladobotryum mycophilum]|uniref:Xylanolytic transcriptional activator regulatory domain-containing protein n=1 Tax=Cladobotryum mycophilum TaxID=491253 RepID=A0ABR0SYD0_9HYPO
MIYKQARYKLRVRSDLLRRHLTLHDVAATSDSKRRGIECSFNRLSSGGGSGSGSGSGRPGASASASSSTQQAQDSAHSPGTPNSGTEASIGDSRSESLPILTADQVNLFVQESGVVDAHLQGLSFPSKEALESILEAVTNLNVNPIPKVPHPSSDEVKKWASAAVQTYFRGFHERWQVIHAPTFENEEESPVVRASVFMIASWFHDDDRTRDLVFEIHGALVKRLLEDLANSDFNSVRPWPIETCQAAMLNIIFAFESGREQSVTKARLLYSLLITVLRQNRVFSFEALKNQINTHFPGAFPHGLATCAFKIDTYLSLLANQPPSLQREEMDLSLTSTFGMWNAYGIDVFLRRYPSEPLDRERFKMCDLALGSQQPVSSGALVEDVQIRMLGTTNYIWILTQMRRNPNQAMGGAGDPKELISGRLRRCKLQLDNLAGLWKEPELHQQHIDYLLRAYLGPEDPSREGWKEMVQTRFMSFIFSTTVLYHLLSLHVYADIHTFMQDLPTGSPNESENLASPSHMKWMEAQEWALSTDGRIAVMHAIFAYRVYGAASSPTGLSEVVDPIAYMALAAGAAVLWTWIMNSTPSCTCAPLLNELDLGFVSLEVGQSPEVEHWIRNGGNIALHGVHICRCNVDVWLSPFAAILSHGARTWETGEGFAQKLWSKLGLQR